MTAPECPICSLVSGGDRPFAYRDDLWHAAVLPGFEVRGWLMLCLRRHAEEATGMNEREAASFGPLVAKLSAALKQVTAAERVYLYAFGEGITHWHVLLASRPPGLPDEHRRERFFGERQTYTDPEGAATVAAEVREALSSATWPEG